MTESALTVCTWNIENGGHDETGDGGLSTRRLREQLDVLTGLGADVIAIQEAKYWRGRDEGWAPLFEAEAVLGMRALPVESNHHGCDLVILIRWPRVRVTSLHPDRQAPWWHALHEIRIRASGADLVVANVHLAPSSPTIRRCEAEALALVAGRTVGGRVLPAIVMGDFNALSAHEPIPDIPEGLPPKAARKLDADPAVAIEEAGFADAAAQRGDLTPTVGHAGGIPHISDRIYTTLPGEALTGYRVITGVDHLSDHRPVVATFTIGGLAGRDGR